MVSGQWIRRKLGYWIRQEEKKHLQSPNGILSSRQWENTLRTFY